MLRPDANILSVDFHPARKSFVHPSAAVPGGEEVAKQTNELFLGKEEIF